VVHFIDFALERGCNVCPPLEVEMAWKDPVQRFLELLRLRTVSSEGPKGSYKEVGSDSCCAVQGCWV
jgi:hypothetical protein